ncbi:MAG: Methionine-tRNA ligase [Parcubacteria group bacterium GW2011_GWA1_47_11]|nr:MAG: Methionine-tRNA ligase [Parcubacteria group bacterium GW2011_GWA1_47_11]
MPKKFFITTAIPYVNAAPHIGFALELIQADTLARYQRQQSRPVFYLNGSDENSLKNVQAAEKAGEEIGAFVARHAEEFRELSKVLNISNDDFIRTTEERHVLGAQKFWQACNAAGDIYKKKYSGLYCVGCEAFITEKELVDGLCPEHRTKPDLVEEENYFFRLSRYQEQLEKLISSGELKITPATRKTELLKFIRQGLEDFSISRSNERAKNWGISVPGDDSQKLYTWFDALTNYINALNFASSGELFNTWWDKESERVHLIGKGITRFHAIYWPAMLLSAGELPPSEVVIHGYITIDGEKISKSLGNTIDPFVVVEKYGLDPVRYFLLREIPSGEDGDFSLAKLEQRYTADLANGLGNLVQRVLTLIDSNLQGELIYDSKLEEVSVLEQIKITEERYHQHIVEFKLHEALADIFSLITSPV